MATKAPKTTKKKTTKNQSLKDKLNNLSRRQATLLLVFVVIFGAAGLWKLYNTNAASAAESDWSFIAPRIRACESGGRVWGQANYKATNTQSSASGAYQFINKTWRSYAPAVGYRHSRAMDALPHEQDAVAKSAFDRNGRRASGTNLWAASYSCWRVGGSIKNAPAYGNPGPTPTGGGGGTTTPPPTGGGGGGSTTTDTYLNISVRHGTSYQLVSLNDTFKSGPRYFGCQNTSSDPSSAEYCPARDIGYCYKTFNVSGSRTCDGFKMGPYSISAPDITQNGYSSLQWSGCDSTSPSGNSCWMRYYDGATRNVTLWVR